MSDFLSTMAESSMARAKAAKAGSGMKGLISRASVARPVVPLQLADSGFDLIAEAKLASPSAGLLVATDDPQARVVELARTFDGAGAVAVSVLTEPSQFDGSIDHLEAAASAVEVPVMRKDFIVDPIQVYEARAAGASGVLLIARLTDPAVLVEMTDTALGFDMFVLVELFDQADLESASVVFDREVLVGVNTRDLTTLEVDPQRLANLAAHLPNHLPAVAESGVLSAQDAESAAALGYQLALVGTGLVTTKDPAETTRTMIAAGRQAAAMGSTP